MEHLLTKENESPTSRRMKARILQSVVEVVAEYGISNTTLAKVATHAGVSQGVLVFHFKSKAGLLAATCQHLTEEYMQHWQPALDLGIPAERIVALITADFSPSICTPQKLALWFAFWGEGNAHDWYDQFGRSAEQLRTDAMIKACCDLPAALDPALLAKSIDCFTDGLWLQMHLQAGQMPSKTALGYALGHLRLLLPDVFLGSRQT